MLHSLRIAALIMLLSTALVFPALARVVVGVTPAGLPGAADRAALLALQDELAARLGDAVQLRSFDSEAALLDWLLRFRELDAALVGRGLPRKLPAGTLVHLADLPAAVAVTHSGLAAERTDALRQAFRALADDARGRQLLARLAGEPAVEPVVARPAPAVTAKPASAVTPKPAPAVTVKAPPAPPVAATGSATPPKSAPPQVAQPTAPPSPATAPQPPIASSAPAPAPTVPDAPAVASQPPAVAAPQPVTKLPAPPPAAPTPPPKVEAPSSTAPAPAPAIAQRTWLLLLAAAVLLIGISLKITLLMRNWRRVQTTALAPAAPPRLAEVGLAALDEPAAAGDSAGAPATLGPVAASAAVSTAPSGGDDAAATEQPRIGSDIIVPVPTPKAGSLAQTETVRVRMGATDRLSFDFRPAGRPAVAAVPPAPPAPAPVPVPADSGQAKPRRKATAAAAAPLFPHGDEMAVIEQGRLGKIKAPALLKRCAELAEPAVLRVRTPGIEICVHFAAGQICHALAHDWRAADETRQWSKLGYLMVREGLISEAQRDQALEMIEREPRLRLAEALRRLDALDLEALRQILARQAKSTIFFLTLFPEGDYRIEADRGAVPAEESISLQVDALIREASHHQGEWTAIRKTLPKLATILAFTDGGQQKLDQVRLSVHQHLLLSQVDGETSVGLLCSTSTMLDYEACRFLYTMVKAGVLEVVGAS